MTKAHASWLFFGVLLVIAPIIAKWSLIEAGFLKTPLDVVLIRFNSFERLICRGELILISIPICGRALGQLFSGFYKRNDWKIVTNGGIGVIALFFFTFYYAYFSNISIPVNAKDMTPEDFEKIKSILWYSYGTFSSSLLIGYSAIKLTKDK